ncbi:hypothetical protein, partial [Escherichia coli]|uniref:hypothetical protein n=1 Tax=Escherichia coli TaxID=562 RepID=UPI0031B62BDF
VSLFVNCCLSIKFLMLSSASFVFRMRLISISSRPVFFFRTKDAQEAPVSHQENLWIRNVHLLSGVFIAQKYSPAVPAS